MKCEKNRFTPLSFVFSLVFLTCQLASTVMATKLIDVFGFVITAGTIVFPITYIIGDLLTEVYGYRQARLTIVVGTACNAFYTLVFQLAIILPYPAYWEFQSDFENILASTPRLFFAGLCSVLFGSLLNARVLSKIKILTQGKYLWVRTIASTIVGEAVDSILFVTVAFIGKLSIMDLINMMIGLFLLKTLYEVIFTPITYLVVRIVKKKEGFDHYDDID